MSSVFPCPSSALMQNATQSAASHFLRFDEQSKTELLLMIQLYLQSEPKYRENARTLFDAIEQNETIPVRYDMNGIAHPQNLLTYLNSVLPFAASLPTLIAQLGRLQTAANPSPVANALPIRFFTSRQHALDRRAEEKIRSPSKLLNVISKRPATAEIHSIHPIMALQSREIGRCVPMGPRTLFRKELLCNLHQHTRILGHLSSIFCVAFDRSGRFLFTGADDNLVKVWDAQRCLLRFTFRGHTGEITDLSVSYDNTLLASGSVDKTIRVWCLRKGTAFRIFRGHTGTVNSVQWVPLMAGPVRYLLSAGNDCAVIFQRYNAQTFAFEDPPNKFNERATGGARIISASHSPGGNLVIIGDTHQSLMMYKLGAQGVDRLYEFQAHSDRIDTLVWSHHSLRFVSGSKDGTAKVWSLDEEGRWSPVELNPFPTVQQQQPTHRTATTDDGQLSGTVVLPQQITNRRAGGANAATTNPNNGYKLTMLCWTLDDDMVISIGSDFLLRCWDWRRGQLLAKYPGHQNDVFCLNAHPIHKELIVSAGHDGLVIVWNVYNGKKLSKHRNENSDREAVAIFDNQISSDGTTIACVDAMGHLSIYGVGHNQEAMKRPHEQFFTTDYKPLEVDTDGRVVDGDTGELPERLPPPPFVKADGTLLPEADQRLVPGNDIASKEVIKPCAWLKRDIVPPLSHSMLTSFWSRQAEITAAELAEFEQKHCPEPSELYNSLQNRRTRGLQRRGAIRRPASAATAASRRLGGVHYRLAEFLHNRAPRYILDNDFPEDENDRSYSASEDDEVEENDGFMLNGIGHDEHSMSSGGTSDLEDEEQETDEDREAAGAGRRANGVRRADEEEEDEDDSDYELGRIERETVFRERSSWTVTGRRKRRPPRPTSADQQRQGTSSQETNANDVNQAADELYFRHSARLRARAAQRSAEEQQQSAASSSQTSNNHQRRYKTRQTAFICSSSEGEELVKQEQHQQEQHQIEEDEEEEEEEDSRQSAASRTSKSRSAPLANGYASVVNGRALSAGGSGKRKKRKDAVGRKKGTAVAERRPQQRKRRRIMLPEMEQEEEEEETEEEEEPTEEEEEQSSDHCDDGIEYSHRPGTSRQSFEHRENGRKRSARATAVPPRLRQLRKRRSATNRVAWTIDDDEAEDESECAVRKLSMEEHERANAHRRIHRFQQSFPQWLRMTERRRFPYFPQLGDEVAYFLQGHKSYLNELKKNGIQISKLMQPRSDLNATEFCFVDKLDWVLHSGIHMARLRLARCQNGRRIGSSFQICFHDMQNVLDFLVLKQHYDTSKQLNFQPGTRVETIVDDKFYIGKVNQVTAWEYESYPNSDWCSISVNWDNDADDRYSPWDLQAWTKGRKPESPATKEDNAKLGEYHPKPGEWPVPEWALANGSTRAASSSTSSWANSSHSAQELFQQRISDLIEQLSHLKEVHPFLEPVDLHEYNDYPTYVFYPMDLTTIQERIHNNFYRRSLAILYDVQLLGKNALAYNKPKYPIVRHACALVETIFVFMEDWKQNDPLSLFRHFVEVGTEGTKYWQLDLVATLNDGGIGSTSTLFTTCSGSASGLGLNNGTARHHQTQQNGSPGHLQMAPGPSSSSAMAELPLWASECSAMVDELSEVFRDRVTQRHQNDLFNNFLASLKSVSDAIVEFQTPQAFVLRVRECLKASKEAAEESGTRRSKVFQVILNLESLLQTKEKPILAKHRLMEAETMAHERQHRRRRSLASNSGTTDGTIGHNNGQQRRPRKAALSANELIQNISQEADWEEFDDHNGQEQQRRRHRKQR